MTTKPADANAPVVSIESLRELARTEQHTFTVPGTSITVVTKGLTMGERSKASANSQKGEGAPGIKFMCWAVHFGMVEPRMSVEEIANLPGNVVEPIYEDIMGLTLPDDGEGDGGPFS